MQPRSHGIEIRRKWRAAATYRQYGYAVRKSGNVVLVEIIQVAEEQPSPIKQPRRDRHLLIEALSATL